MKIVSAGSKAKGPYQSVPFWTATPHCETSRAAVGQNCTGTAKQLPQWIISPCSQSGCFSSVVFLSFTAYYVVIRWTLPQMLITLLSDGCLLKCFAKMCRVASIQCRKWQCRNSTGVSSDVNCFADFSPRCPVMSPEASPDQWPLYLGPFSVWRLQPCCSWSTFSWSLQWPALGSDPATIHHSSDEHRSWRDKPLIIPMYDSSNLKMYSKTRNYIRS